MRINFMLTKKSYLVLASVIGGVLGFGGTAQAAVFTFAPASDITISTTPGTANASFNTGTLSTTATPNGFSGVFSSNYTVIGATSAQNISASAGGTSARTSIAATNTGTQPITINATEAALKQLITFNWAFQGNASTTADSVNIYLENENSTDFYTFSNYKISNAGGYGSGSEVLVVPQGALTPDGSNYLVRFELVEAGGGLAQNSAFAFNNLTVETGVPFEFTPSLGIVSVAGLWGGSILLKKLRQKSLTKKGE
jgi:hypothetical protein